MESENFQAFLREAKIEVAGNIINARGVNNLENPELRQAYVSQLKSQGAEEIIILRDLEDHPCITSAKEKTDPENACRVFVAKQAIETWLIADEAALSSFLKQKNKL
ncbi:MAG: hypothetical protein GYB31_01955 [Bacteroidetes bacterium]|nr:hypothetical protein [Bacteroidota bacterium]